MIWRCHGIYLSFPCLWKISERASLINAKMLLVGHRMALKSQLTDYSVCIIFHICCSCCCLFDPDMFLILSSRLDSERQSIMPLHKYAPKMWDALKLKQGIYARLPKHYLKSLEQKEPTPVHWKPLGVEYRRNPKTGHKERVQDVPIPIYYPPQSQDGLWGGEGWISGFRYANNDKVSLHNIDFPSLVLFVVFIILEISQVH